MKLGLSQACYRWVCYPPLRHDNAGVYLFNVADPAFLNYGRPLPYVNLIAGPEPGRHIEWLVARCVALGLSPLYMTSTWLTDDDHARRIGQHLRRHGVDLIAGGSADFAAAGAAWESERARFIRHMELGKLAGADLIAAVHNGAIEHNHFSKDPPIAVQIERMIANFTDLCRAAERIGIVMAFENHMDYRCSEIAQVIESVASPWLRVNFDFANSLSVIEDPVDAVKAVARWTVMTHIKDMRVQPKTLDGEPRILWSTVGDGSVDIDAILRILLAEAPDPTNLPHCLEICPLPDQDPELWVRKSIGWLDRHHGHLFPDSARRRHLTAASWPITVTGEA